MSKTIKFKSPEVVWSFGRNGNIKTTGLYGLVSQNRDVMWLQPITSRGNIGNCVLAFPKTEIDAVIKLLMDLEKEIDNEDAQG